MNRVRKKPAAISAIARVLSLTAATLPAAGWSAAYSAGTDYKITLPGATPAFSWQSKESETDTEIVETPRSEMLFKLSPNFIDSEFGDPTQKWGGDLSIRRVDFIKPSEAKMQDLHRGFSYSAAIDLESSAQNSKGSKEIFSDSNFISSRQLGIHYGRLGTVNYSGVDLSFRQFNDKTAASPVQKDDKELWSLGVTTGRRFALTGLETSDPMWTVSLRGQFNLVEKPNDDVALENQQWYLSPGLHWEHDSFRMSADVLMPFMQSGEYEEETDYRIRAKIQKRF